MRLWRPYGFCRSALAVRAAEQAESTCGWGGVGNSINNN